MSKGGAADDQVWQLESKMIEIEVGVGCSWFSKRVPSKVRRRPFMYSERGRSCQCQNSSVASEGRGEGCSRCRVRGSGQELGEGGVGDFHKENTKCGGPVGLSFEG